MELLLKFLVYYLAGSAVAGGVMGASFTTNLEGKPGGDELKPLEGAGTSVEIPLDGIEGSLLVAPGERRPTIIYVHGRSANRTEMMPLALTLFARGYNAVLWDSTSRRITYGPREVEQIHRLAAWVRDDPHVDPARVYVLGFSLGGAMAIGAAGSDPAQHIRAIVADSAYANLESVASRYMSGFGVIPGFASWPARKAAFATARVLHGIDLKTLNPEDWAMGVSCPTLLIHGTADWRIPPENSRRIFERLPGSRELWLVDEAGHTEAFRRNPAAYAARVQMFLDAHGAD